MALREQPYLPLYVQDFISDEKLRECSAESVGVYIFLMCVMHKNEEYGKITLNQKYFTNTICLSKIQANPEICLNFATMLSKQMPFPVPVIERSLNELLNEKVICLDGQTLIQKRMVKDCEISQKRAVSGSSGGKQRIDNLPIICSSKIQANPQAKSKQNTESENEYVIKDESESVIKDISAVEDVIPFKEIVDHLNLKAKTAYRHTSEKTKDLIRARINEKFTLQDFYTVINKKAGEWIDTDMQKYLRPETLFSNKFEGYLNQKIIKTPRSTIPQKNFDQRVYSDELLKQLDGGSI